MYSRGDKIDGRYEVIRLIGEGGMANVYLAYDTLLDRNVAVKVLRGDLASDEKFVKKFRMEAVRASSLSHPNIVEVYDVGEDDGKYFIVMEYVQGSTLKQVLKKRGSLTLPEVVDIMAQLTSAIYTAHQSYIIHRDIKAQNVMLLEDGRVKIMDFGIASSLNSNELTQTGSVMGTVYYLPPELAHGEQASIKSDIYSLGILMYELIVGRVPFKGDSPVEVALKQVKEKIPDLTEANEDIPQSISNIILRACAKNPKNRYDSAKEMHDDIVTALDKDRQNEPKIVYEYPEDEFDEVKETREEKNKKKNEDKKINNGIKVLSIIVIVLVLALVMVFYVYPTFINKPSIEVPDVSGKKISSAEKILEDKGFKVASKTSKKTSDDIKKGYVIETDPEAGRTIDKGSTIKLIVSNGSKKITVEDYTGKNYYEVKAKLEEYKVKVETDKRDVADTDKPEEYVILDQDVKKGDKLGKGDTITLTIPNIYVTYPDFSDGQYTVDRVKTFADKNKISLDITYTTDQAKENGTIINQNMGIGAKVNEGDNLKITVIKNDESEDNAGQNNQTNQ